MIAADAGGIPRRINLLADKALTVAEQTERTQVSPTLLTTIFHDHGTVASAPSSRDNVPRTGKKAALRAPCCEVGCESLRFFCAQGLHCFFCDR